MAPKYGYEEREKIIFFIISITEADCKYAFNNLHTYKC